MTAQPLYALPANVGPRTMDYSTLFGLATHNTNVANVKVFSGTVDDPFWIDLGAAFDTLNLRTAVGGGVLTPAQDASSTNVASDSVSGYAVNAIAIEVPVSLLTRTGANEAATSTEATIGVWGTTSRQRSTVRRAPMPAMSSGPFSQIQRMGNPLINELLIGTGSKDRFSMDEPPAGPVADMLQLNTGVAPNAPAAMSRLGLLGGDPAGYPNGRRLGDDVVDISLRVVAGVLVPAFNITPNNRLGDGVNVIDVPYRTTFPYVGNAPNGRDRRHIDPSEPGCAAGAGAPCAP